MAELTPRHHSREQGQAILLIVFVFIGLLAAVGLVVDLGRYLVTQTQLRRAADAAALAGSAQFRLSTESPTPEAVYGKIRAAALDTLRAHNVSSDTLASGAFVMTCNGDGVTSSTIDGALCTIPPTKKVKVQINQQLPLVFLSLVGWRYIDLSAEATTEAAAVDVALLIDVSDSMANDTCPGGDYQCQWECENTAGPCQPMQKARDAALAFLDFLSPGYDRVSVVPFDAQAGYCINVGDVWPDCAVSAYDPLSNPDGLYLKLPTEYEGLGKIDSNINDARAFITQLKLGIPEWVIDPVTGAPYNPIPPCPGYNAAEGYDPRQCTNTNVGGGIRAGASELLKEFDEIFPVTGAGENHRSKERLRVMVLLTDGAANASGLGAEGPAYGTPYQFGYCPQYTWYAPPPPNPFCRAPFPGFTIGTGRHISTSVDYDAIDYALDWADFTMLKESGGGNDVVVFTIGLGNQVVSAPSGDPQVGEKLLRYMAAGGDDGDLATDLCAGVPSAQSCGNYYFAPTGDQLLDIFKAIAGRIFTRINQ